MGTKMFEIAVWEETGGYMTVWAETEEEARDMARKYIEDYGVNYGGDGIRVTHRNTELV